MSRRDLPRYPKPEALLQLPDYGHAIIEASAGTGKTFTIEHLVVDLVITHGIPIGEILVVTFTERATAELKRRIRGKLEELLALEETTTVSLPENCWILDASATERVDQALVDFDTASISTIHALCHAVLTENAFLGGRLFEQEHVDERAIFGRAFIDVLRTELARNDELLPYLTAWLETRSSSVNALEELLFQAARLRASLAPSFDPARLASAAERLPVIGVTATQLEDARVHRSSIDKVLRHLEALRDATSEYHRSKDVAALIAELDDVDLSYLSSKLSSFGKLSAAIDELHEASVALSAAIVERFLPLVQERLARIKREQGLFDFHDMLALVERTLSGPRGRELAVQLQSHYRFALIDEFQDTDELQWSIFRKLFFESGASNPLRLVGDPKQAIYGFRGADVHVYLEAKADLVARSAVVPLVENFRSTPELIECLNKVFDQRGDTPFFTGNVRYELPLQAGRPELRCIGAHGASRSPLVLLRGDDKEALLDQIADEILALESDASRKLRFGPEGEERTVGAEEIFVLTRTAREGDEVGEALAARGVDFAFYKRDGLFASREAEDVKNLLDAVASPHDRSKRFRAWMTSFFGLSLAELERAADLPSSDPLMARLTEWGALAHAKDFETLFPRILEQSGVLRRELFRGRGERGFVNMTHLFEILLEEVHRTQATLPELVRTLERFMTGAGFPPGSDRDTMRLETDHAVQIMTMHMSKGLEAGVVFVYAFSSGRTSSVHGYYEDGERKAYVGRLTDAPDGVQESVARERLEEDQRLFYVAATRAKARLYLPWVPADMAGLGCYAQLNRRLNDIHNELEVLEASSPKPNPAGESSAASVALDNWTPQPELLSAPDSKHAYDLLRAEHRGLVVTSYSRMKHLRGGYRPPIDEPADLENVEEAGLPRGTATGVFLHEVIEHLDFETLTGDPDAETWCNRSEVSELFRRAMRKNGVDPRFRMEAEQLVYTAMTSPVSFGDYRLEQGFASVKDELREMEFVYPYPEADAELRRGFVKGYVDFVFDLDSRTFFCDFKSDVLPAFDAKTLASHVGRNYTLQAKLYTLALVKMLEVDAEENYEARFGGLLYCFLRGMPERGLYYERPSWSTLAAWRDELTRETRL